MRWQIEHLVFCDLQQTLTDNQHIEQLEPMVVELLSYFCQNPSKIISRDELVESVWLGRTITDNAVNRVVTKLRKVLSDNPKQPKFIATFPKKGYKFIVTPRLLDPKTAENRQDISDAVSQDSNQNQYQKSNSVASSTISRVLFFLLVILAIIFYFVLGVDWNRSNNLPITKVKALTRGAGQESQPKISPDLNYLAFVEFNGTKMRTKIKSLADEREIEISHGEDDSIWIGSLSWSDDGKLIVYLVTTSSSCQYFLRKITGLTVGEPKLIHNCTVGSYGKIAFTHDNDRLIYSESEGRNTPFSLFELTLSTDEKRRLNQPALFLGGNSQFDIHPVENKLLISSPDKQQWEGFYSLDLETDRLELLFKQDAYICCGIWDHQGERVVLMGEHPAYQLVSFDLNGQDRKVIYSGGQKIRSPERHANGKDYLLVAGRVNMNVIFFDNTLNRGLTIADSSVDDRLARFAHHNNQIAYISLASGQEDIWLTNTQGSPARRLTNFIDHPHYIDLIWSYKGEFLIGVALNEIHLIDSETGNLEKLKLSQTEIRGVSLRDNHTVSFSSKISGEWRIANYDLNTHTISYEDSKWSYVNHSFNPEDTWWRDQQGQLYYGPQKVIEADREVLQAEYLSGRSFNLKRLDQSWYWQDYSEGSYKLRSKTATEMESQVLLTNQSLSFDISEHGVLYHQIESSNADIYTSVSQ